MCSEDGLYYDVTLKRCMQFLDLSKMNDFTFRELPSAYSGNYAMAFWIFFEESDIYSERGLHLKWSRHLQITIFKKEDQKLKGFCFPQAYYTDYTDYEDDDTNFLDKYDKALNKAKIPLVRDGTSEDGVWIWVVCSVSNYYKKYFLKGNGAPIEATIISENLYYSDTTREGQPVRNKYPYHYFMSEVNNGESQTSKLNIEGLANEKRIYI